MAEGCLNKTTKYFLFASNLLIFILGAVVLATGIWILVDKPSFFDILDQASGVCAGDSDCDAFGSDLYELGAYTMIGFSAFMVFISFFGCCGAIKENKCMLGTYFAIIVGLFILMLVGAIMGYFFEFEKRIKIPLDHALESYRDTGPTVDRTAEFVHDAVIDVVAETDWIGYKRTWNKIQEELHCCGVSGVTDWSNPNATFKWEESDYNKPEGCCLYKRGSDAELSSEEIIACRRKTTVADNDDPIYYFEGCYDFIREQIQDYQYWVIGLAIGIVAIMFLNMLFSFSLCMMVPDS